MSVRVCETMPESASYEQVKSHYEALLGEHYTWTMGGSRAKHGVNYSLLSDVLADVIPRRATGSDKEATSAKGAVTAPTTAVDLGCGSGFQTIPLLELGFSVYAVDASDALLRELQYEAAELDPAVVARLHPLCGDILRFRALLPTSGCSGSIGVADGASDGVSAIVCMGDTLTHLGSLLEVQALVAECYAALRPGGRIVLQFRDLTTPLHGTDRFIPVRSDERTVFTCFLEWENADVSSRMDGGKAVRHGANADTDVLPCDGDGSGCRVRVHDLVHVKKGIGAWELCKSSYTKIGLTGAYVCGVLKRAGFDRVEMAAEDGGLVLVVGVRPAPPIE